ncbi:hypothetical protein A6V39_05345 [Candidatus Mycoplasma haematobovis]|uniref:CD-NTase-associated protein 12/Pycsar effector protein TIR domain-containing protein n=1 Tax=Candidatus Mycoplasma haematobovis TaxID=432608 RepID=A0A1A9QDH9_9MOLU|nr:TIR domain-containing protein [Candidatus Mycoplasma haematobovis]OAL09760.1 hypothetical protein A6V39_05345 [Candidatus Mycoplasma haematobovis]
MKKPKNKCWGESIVKIFEDIRAVAENFSQFGITDLTNFWIKKVKFWAEENDDLELLSVVYIFEIWKDKESLKKITLIVSERQQYFLRRKEIKNNIFIAHNHNDPLAKELQMFLFKEKFNPIIMQEQPNTGTTIFDKFTNLEFNIAIILLTEDPNFKKTTKISQFKANVIFEAGYCYSHLDDRANVIIMYDGKVEIPSNIGAIEYIKIDKDWKYNLTNSLKARGLMKS